MPVERGWVKFLLDLNHLWNQMDLKFGHLLVREMILGDISTQNQVLQK